MTIRWELKIEILNKKFGKFRKVKYGIRNVNLNFKIKNDIILIIWDISWIWGYR